MKKLLLLMIFAGISSFAFANATVAQKEWRWRNNDGNETTATWSAAQDQPATKSLCRAADTIRLRVAFLINYDPANPNNTANKNAPYQISYATSPAGPFTQIENYQPGTNAFIITGSTFVTNSTPTTQQLVSSGGGFIAGQTITQNTGSSISFTTPASTNSITEHEWVIKPTQFIQAQTYYFKLVGLNTYPNTLPSITYTTVAPTASTQNITVCDSYTSPSGNYTWTASGTYMDTIMNAVGCDSVITTNLTLAQNAGTVSESKCDSYTSPSGNYTWTTSGVYTDTLTNVTGCDSVLTINLAISNSNTGDTTATACDSFEWKNSTYTSSGSYTATLTNVAGCDSIVTLHLTIYTVDATVTVNNETITANSASATYQWVDCSNNNTPIANETSQSFVATANGSYAVIVTENGCQAMSSCEMIVSTGVNESVNSTAVSLYPNPNNGSFTIEAASTVVIEVRNTIGQVVMSKTVNTGRSNLEIENAVAGVYYMTAVDANGNRTTQRIVVAK
jgi:hypothetical protein